MANVLNKRTDKIEEVVGKRLSELALNLYHFWVDPYVTKVSSPFQSHLLRNTTLKIVEDLSGKEKNGRDRKESKVNS